MTRRDKAIYLVLLAGVLIGVPGIPAGAVVAFMNGRDALGGLLLVALVNLCTAFVCWEAKRRRMLGRPFLLYGRKKSLSRLFEATSPAPDGADAFEALVDEKTLALIAVLTSLGPEEDSKPDPELVRVLLEGFITRDMITDAAALAEFRAGAAVIAYLTGVLARERGESVQATWQREAMHLSTLISSRSAS
ncbi:hypothetical protein [Sphaerisporangium sp. TRM90804]|uniref:hypothetical protein n=1 Tax=Sphaerisporangium sp. TRM90804 TaxID=3031113 RepID=UPI00244A40CD|nr:hypothetical protein [Sphaerisporangium sp. TRM90804]MDH2424780.1 hypothetical protein [Sphaerisporangium sp. TRM90804]